MKRIQAGVYETPNGKYRVERVDSFGEGWSNAKGTWVETTSSVWVVTERPLHEGGEWAEVTGDYPTKRQATAALIRLAPTEWDA